MRPGDACNALQRTTIEAILAEFDQTSTVVQTPDEPGADMPGEALRCEPVGRPSPALSDVIHAVSEIMGRSPRAWAFGEGLGRVAIRSTCRKAYVITAREETDASFPEIARAIGWNSHSVPHRMYHDPKRPHPVLLEAVAVKTHANTARRLGHRDNPWASPPIAAHKIAAADRYWHAKEANA